MGVYDGLNPSFSPYRPNPAYTQLQTNKPTTLADILQNFGAVDKQVTDRRNAGEWRGFEGDISTEEGARQAAGMALKQGDVHGALQIMQAFKQAQAKPSGYDFLPTDQGYVAGDKTTGQV